MSEGVEGRNGSRRGPLLGCLGLVVLVIGVPVACTAVSMSDGGDEWAPTALEARLICEDWVTERLVSPSTAEFNDGTTTGGPVAYTVTGSVDSQNAMGGTLRTDWSCEVEYRESDQQWHGRVDVD